MKPNIKVIIFVSLILFVVLIGVLHSITPGYMIFYHDTYRRLSYFPITIGAIMYGVWGGLLLAVLSCLSFVPHLLTFWARGPEAYYSELSEILFYLAAGLVIGLISSRENRLREKYKLLSEKLSVSYQRLHDQTSQLVKAEKHLGESQKLSMLGHVSASLAHEIKNPLASIKGAAEILSDEVPESHPKHEFIEIMRAEISRLNHSVEDVLKYCRGQQHQHKGRQEPIEKIVNHVVSLLETHLNEKSISLTVESTISPGECLADEPTMIQVIMNILINAVEAVKKDGKIVVNINEEDNGCVIQIMDDGPGIDETIAEDIFQSFVTHKQEGTGLGLSIVKTSIESLGGTISLTPSNLGGAGFAIRLPEKTFQNNGSL